MNTTLKNLCLVALFVATGISYGQIRIANNTANSIAPNSSAFIDASSNPTYNSSTNIGKGLLYPRVDLTTFTAFSGTPTGIPTSYPNRYDGFVVYNTAATGTAGVGTTQGTLTQGFWFYENKTGTLNGGTWKPLGATDTKVEVGVTESITNLVIAGEQVYAVKGSFTADGTTTAVTLANPSGIETLYRITIYKDGAVYGTSVYSYNKATGAAFTGTPGMSVVYPAATYDYVMEYFK